MKWPQVSEDREIQAVYELSRAAGTSHMLAEVFAFRKAPASGLDETRFLSVIAKGNQFGGEVRDTYEKEARRAGVSVKGKYYVPGIASPEPGRMSDPKAWVGSLSELRENANRNHIKIKSGISELAPVATEGFRNQDEKLQDRKKKKATQPR